MPKLTRQQRAWGAKEKLDRLSAPALRELRMNLANVRAWMQSGQVVEKAVEVQKEEEPSEPDDTQVEEPATFDPVSPREVEDAEGAQGLPAEAATRSSPSHVRLELDHMERQASLPAVSPHNAEAAKVRQLKRWESAFQRLQNQGEVDRELLLQGIELAGFTIVRQEWLDQVVAEITTYTTLDMDEFMQVLQGYEAKQYAEFISVFEHFDIDQNGHLERDELAALLEQCGITALDQVLKEILVEVAPVDSSHLTLEEFRKVVEIIHVNEGFSSREIIKLKEIFRRFDLDKGGFLDTSELHKALAWLGFGLTSQEVEDISNSCDVGGKGSLQEHEFVGFMRKVKEREIYLVKKALSKQRPDAGSVYMQKQLDRVLRTLGYIPNARAIRDAGEDAGIIRVNPAEVVEQQGHGIQPWKPVVSGAQRRQSFISSGSRRTSVGTMATLGGSSRRVSAVSSRRDSANSHSANADFTVPKTITLSSFFNFLEVYRSREGLDRTQILELESVFRKYDRKGYGEMDIKDVGKVLRWMGYSANFDVQLMLTREVDVDESGTLDSVELRKLVRKFQEKELTAWTLAFHRALKPGERFLEVEACVQTLRSLGIKATAEQVEEAREAVATSFPAKQRRFSTVVHVPNLAAFARMQHQSILLKPGKEPENSSSSSFADGSGSSSEEASDEDDLLCSENIDLAVFHLICSRLVTEAKQSIRENAGYTVEEVQHMREKFTVYDKNKSGDIDNQEMAKLMQDLCPDLATNRAKRAEITRILSEVDPDKTGLVDFPDFLRLMRQVDEMQDRLRMAKEAFAIEKSKFSSREVEEFRKLFLGEENKKGCFRGQLRLEEFLELLEPVVGLGRKNGEDLTQLFFEIDRHMHPEFAQKVVEPTSPKSRKPRYGEIDLNKPRVAVDFPEFLILMSLLLEKNLCQVKEKSTVMASSKNSHSERRGALKHMNARLH